MKYAQVIDGQVCNVIQWDGVSQYEYEGQLLALEEGSSVQIGWSFWGGSFSAPPTPEPTPEEVARESALAKLMALGLTEQEALALAGG